MNVCGVIEKRMKDIACEMVLQINGQKPTEFCNIIAIVKNVKLDRKQNPGNATISLLG